MLTVDQAEAAVREYWDSPVGSEVAEAARFNRARSLVLWEIEARLWRDLFRRLGGTFSRNEKRLFADEPPVLLPLLALIDRRPRMGIQRPLTAEEERIKRYKPA